MSGLKDQSDIHQKFDEYLAIISAAGVVVAGFTVCERVLFI
jgi:hypothetical protein